ncbi:MAG: MoxR family ATPase [Nanoarchaeales archaeon]|nr:MoxR family ATPase [Nanoarchaeales archaeon]
MSQNKELLKKIESKAKIISSLKNELGKVIVGQKEIIEKTIICVLANGNLLLEGAPGLAKTLLINTLADASSCSFSRIQFTPDLLPSDIIGTKIFNQKDSTFETKKGPIFANFVLADEINRAPPKTQSALLEAMAEKQVTILGDTYKLDKPFLVFATQNPIEQEGTYPLPEAQIDRFMFKLLVEYPSKSEELEILERMTTNVFPSANAIISNDEIIELQTLVREVYIDDLVKEYIVSIVDATRNPKEYDVEYGKFIEWGASPRANIFLTLGAKACALVDGREYVNSDDVKKIVYDILRHRLILSYEADIENVSTHDVIDEILEKVKCP